MSLDTEIVDALNMLALKNIKPNTKICTVAEAVDTSTWTVNCSPVNGDAMILDVRLMSTAAKGFLVVPAVNSIVLVTMIDDHSGYISMTSDIDSIQLNGDTYDGLVKVTDLVTKLNNVENKINSLITTFNAWTPVANDGGAALKATLSTWVATSLTNTVKADLENTTVKHGNGT